jgi:SAM-dependent methyltransferase
MRIHTESLSDVDRYIANHRKVILEDRRPDFKRWLARIRRFIKITLEMKIMEVGTGIGWFPVLCSLNGISCKGMEISPQLVACGKEFGRRYGVETDIELGNIEEKDIGQGQYEAIVAWSVFEHVEFWQKGLENIYRALKLGGVFFFYSTNKLSLKSGEYKFPFYGWLPNRVRYRLRMARQGADIMKLGIDFNQFRYPRLRREFRRLGYSRILDRIDLLQLEPMRYPVPWKATYLRLCRKIAFLKHLALTFMGGTEFVCIK